MTRPLTRVSVYINEADEWHGRPLHLEVLRMLHARGIAGGTVLRAVAGFTGKGGVETTSLVDAGGKLPLVIEFIDRHEKVEIVMPELMKMAGRRLIVRQEVRAEETGAPGD
jgi:PII-like signaling protein